jgi:peptidoglycan hydrolase-like protein with peptidoglycan-binding domain
MSTQLEQIYESGRPVSIDSLKGNAYASLVRSIQTKLCDCGVLDPIILGNSQTPFRPIRPDDGVLGPETKNGIAIFQQRMGLFQDLSGNLIPDFFKKLHESAPDELFPLQFIPHAEDNQQVRFAKRILRYMKRKGYWIARSPNMFNIVYVEGVDSRGRLLSNTPNYWNDRRCVIRILPGGLPEMLVNDAATTEPGRIYTLNPVNPKGAARIAFGQYKAWRYGLHRGRQPALVQRSNVRLHRDMNMNFRRDPSDKIDIGYGYGINQHSTKFNYDPLEVDEFSAGCLVGRRYNYHLSFLYIIRHDYRYVHNPNYLFMTTVINGRELIEMEPE